jgi:hypothetical protein
MKKDYTVAMHFAEGKIALTIRCLESNKHFKRKDGNPNCIYNSQEENPKMFTIMFEGPLSEARKFLAVQQAAYKLVGVTRSKVKEEGEENE